MKKLFFLFVSMVILADLAAQVSPNPTKPQVNTGGSQQRVKKPDVKQQNNNSQTNNQGNNQQTNNPSEVTAVQTGVRVNAQLAKVDTLSYVIGRSDFRLLNNNTGEYMKILPQGVTIKTESSSGKSSNSLVAPLHLPVGAIIRNVKLNYVMLPQGGVVPHLVLRSHYLTSQGGYGINKAITSFWVSSNNLNGSNGYNVQTSGTSQGFNVAVSKGSTHYFEILAGSSQSTNTPQQSIWPDNEKIFIWSIDVQYTLPAN